MEAVKLPGGCALVALDETDSTNTHAKNLAREGCSSGTVVWAQRQTAGRGRQGNVWTSMPGNLFMSIVLRPETTAALTGQLSFLTAVALYRTLRSLLPADVHVALKWPNDVLIGGKKAAGILLETEAVGGTVPWVVVGVGVNIVDAPDGAVSLRAVKAAEGTDAALVLQGLAGHIMSLYADWKKDGFGMIHDAWMEHAHGLNAPITVRLPRETLEGVFHGIDGTGALLLGLADGTEKAIASGEVYA